MSRVACYARVSSHDQEKTESIETQRFYLEQWTKTNEHEMVGWYGDVDVRSVVPVHERPEGGRLLRDAAKGKFDAVVIYRLGRWSRYTQVWHDGKARLDAAGVELICLKEDIRDDTPGDRFSLGVKLLVNELDRDTIAQNCLDGKYRRAHEGGYTGGIVPYGYRVTGTRGRWLEPDPEEAEVVRRLFRWLVDERLTCVQIARRLNALRVPTACQNPDEGRHRKHCKDVSGLWSNSRVSRIVRNPAYCGEKEFGVSNQGKRDRVTQKGVALVDRDTWQRAQVRLDENRVAARRNRKYDYLLRGVVICAHCGRRCYGKTMNKHSRRPISYYVCNRKTLKYQGYEPDLPPCPLPHVRADELESGLWRELWPIIKDSERTIERVRERLTDTRREENSLQESIDALRAALERKQSARRRAVTMATDGLITRAELAEQMERIQKDADELAAQIEALTAQRDREVDRERLLGEAAIWLKHWRAVLSGDITPAKKREAIEHFVASIELHATEAGIVPVYRFCLDQPDRSCVPYVTAYGIQLLTLTVRGDLSRRAA